MIIPAFRESDGSLRVGTPWLTRLLTLFLYVSEVVIDGRSQRVSLKTRYLWFFKSERDLSFDRIKRLDYSCKVTRRKDKYGNVSESAVFTIGLVLKPGPTDRNEVIEVAKFSHDDWSSRDFLDRVQEITGKPLIDPSDFQSRQPDPALGKLSIHSEKLYDVLELCCAYVAGLDNRFTDIEKHWVDEQFGPGAADRMLSDNRISDPDGCFGDIRSRLHDLTPGDRYFMKTQARSLFQTLLKSDGRQKPEQERMNQLMDYLRESLPTG